MTIVCPFCRFGGVFNSFLAVIAIPVINGLLSYLPRGPGSLSRIKGHLPFLASGRLSFLCPLLHNLTDSGLPMIGPHFGLERGSFPNLNGTVGKRVVTAISADDMKYINPGRRGWWVNQLHL